MRTVCPSVAPLRMAAPRRAAAQRGAALSVQATSRVDQCNKKSVIVAPSILSANFAKLGEQARAGAAGSCR